MLNELKAKPTEHNPKTTELVEVQYKNTLQKVGALSATGSVNLISKSEITTLQNNQKFHLTATDKASKFCGMWVLMRSEVKFSCLFTYCIEHAYGINFCLVTPVN